MISRCNKLNQLSLRTKYISRNQTRPMTSDYKQCQIWRFALGLPCYMPQQNMTMTWSLALVSSTQVSPPMDAECAGSPTF